MNSNSWKAEETNGWGSYVTLDGNPIQPRSIMCYIYSLERRLKESPETTKVIKKREYEWEAEVHNGLGGYVTLDNCIIEPMELVHYINKLECELQKIPHIKNICELRDEYL